MAEDKGIIDRAIAGSISWEMLTKWFLGLLAATILFALGWFVSQTRESGNHEARLAVLESNYKILSDVVQNQKAQDVRIVTLESQMGKMLTRDEHLVFYAQVIEALRDLKTEQVRVRTELETHDRRMVLEHPGVKP